MTTKDNVTNLYGRTSQATLGHPKNPRQKIFQWFLELTYDDKGNYVHYLYKPDTLDDLPNEIFEAHRKNYETHLRQHFRSISNTFAMEI